MLETCFSSPATGPFAADIERFHGHVHSERWGTTAAAATQLTKVFNVLAHGWDKQRFLNHGQVENRDAQHSCTDSLE